MLNPNHSLAENLIALKTGGKGARLQLKNGQEIAGVLGELTDHWVVIHELVGKEFYDALVRLEDVTALIVRTK